MSVPGKTYISQPAEIVAVPDAESAVLPDADMFKLPPAEIDVLPDVCMVATSLLTEKLFVSHDCPEGNLISVAVNAPFAVKSPYDSLAYSADCARKA